MGGPGIRRTRPNLAPISWLAVVLAVSGSTILASCNTGASTASQRPEATAMVSRTAPTSFGPSPTASVPTSGPVATALGPCSLFQQTTDWLSLPDYPGRCNVTVFSPPMSFDWKAGWRWAGDPDRWAMTRDNGAFTILTTYRYGGAVVPAYCEDPPDTIQMSAGSEIVAWLQTAPGLEVRVTGRSVDSNPAWELDLAAPGVESCSGDPGKAGLGALWTIDGQPIELPETLGESETMRVYLIELAAQIVIMTARTNPIESLPGIPDNTDFLSRVDEIFSSLVFE